MTLLLKFLGLSCLPIEELPAVLSLKALVVDAIIKTWLDTAALLLKPGVLLTLGTTRVSCSLTGVLAVDYIIGVIRNLLAPMAVFVPKSLFAAYRALMELSEI